MRIKGKKLIKSGTSSSAIYFNDNIVNKFLVFKSEEEKNSFSKGFEILHAQMPNSILKPNKVEDTSYKNKLEIKYEQKLLSPWISHEWMTGQKLYELAKTILNQQNILFREGLCLVDSRPQNYWLLPDIPLLVDIGSIKPLTTQNLESFRIDFLRYIINPLTLESKLGIPVSSYFKGKLYNQSLKQNFLLANWFSFTRLKYYLRFYIQDFLSSKILNSSPEFIDYLNEQSSESDKKIKTSELKKFLKTHFNLLKKSKPNLKTETEWNYYCDFHNKEYSYKKDKEVNKFLKNIEKNKLIVDLGSNLTTISSKRINLKIDYDIGVCNALEKSKTPGQNIFSINIAEALIDENKKDFNALNFCGLANIAIINGLIHHLIIDCGIDTKEFYKSLSKLYNEILLEFPDKNDPMVRLLIRKKNESIEWERNQHENFLLKYFDIIKTNKISGTRYLFHLKKRFE